MIFLDIVMVATLGDPISNTSYMIDYSRQIDCSLIVNYIDFHNFVTN